MTIDRLMHQSRTCNTDQSSTMPTQKAPRASQKPASAKAAAAAPAPAISAADWNVEASELVKELTATQKEVAAMLSGQQVHEQELSGMKEACCSEVRALMQR